MKFEMWFVVRKTLEDRGTRVVGSVYQTDVQVKPDEQDILDLLLGLEYLDRGCNKNDEPLFTVKDVVRAAQGRFMVDAGSAWIELRPVKSEGGKRQPRKKKVRALVEALDRLFEEKIEVSGSWHGIRERAKEGSAECRAWVDVYQLPRPEGRGL